MEEQVEVVAEVMPAKGVCLKAHHKAEWVRRFKQSGLSLRAFSRQHGLRCGSLCSWVNKEHAAKLVSTSPGFLELKLPAMGPERSSWVAELSYGDGKVLRISADISAAVLEQLLRVC